MAEPFFWMRSTECLLTCKLNFSGYWKKKKFFRLGGKNYFNLEARIIAAANRDLNQEVKQGTFRSDLYYRLSIFEIHIPPLRERKGDIKFLALKFMQEISGKIGKKVEGFSPEAIAHFEQYTWPGNVRELKNWIERAVYLTEGSILTLKDFFQDTSGKTRQRRLSPKAGGRFFSQRFRNEYHKIGFK